MTFLEVTDRLFHLGRAKPEILESDRGRFPGRRLLAKVDLLFHVLVPVLLLGQPQVMGAT